MAKNIKNKFNNMPPEQFTHKLFGTVRVLHDSNGETWFVAMDICKALGLSNMARAVEGLDLDAKGNTNIPHSGNDSNNLRKTRILDESGLYSLIILSRKPEAQKFKNWVTKEVLPSIRKTGSYALPNSRREALSDLTDPVAAARAWADQMENKFELKA
ncbi:Bro-N domain-containing protein [Maridesulfovibrio sp.]|uniref:BRO-N domain-containing protein n=1 Tax=Maridesulfovibrio sp. TaxID=2795000 RepID=UPI0039EE92E1